MPQHVFLQSAQDRNDVMDQLQWRAIAKVAAKFVKTRNLKTTAIQNKSTGEAVFIGITTIYAETFTHANAQKINYKPESGRAFTCQSVWVSQRSSWPPSRTLHLEP